MDYKQELSQLIAPAAGMDPREVLSLIEIPADEPGLLGSRLRR